MERLLLCALVLLRPLDAIDAANTQDPSFQPKTTRGILLCPEGNGQHSQHLDVPACQGTPCPSLTTGSLTTRLDQSRWPTDGSLETKDSDPKGGKGPGGSWSFKENTLEHWSELAIDLLILGGVLLLSALICCCYASACRRNSRHDPHESEQLLVRSTSSSLEGPRDYGTMVITSFRAEGQESPSPVDRGDKDKTDYDYYYDDVIDSSGSCSDSNSDYNYGNNDDNNDKPPLLFTMDSV